MEFTDLSRESLYSDEGYSNRYGSVEDQERAYNTYDRCDEIPIGKVRSIVGLVTGTEASSSIERLLGSRNRQHIEEDIR